MQAESLSLMLMIKSICWDLLSEWLNDETFISWYLKRQRLLSKLKAGINAFSAWLIFIFEKHLQKCLLDLPAGRKGHSKYTLLFKSNRDVDLHEALCGPKKHNPYRLDVHNMGCSINGC